MKKNYLIILLFLLIFSIEYSVCETIVLKNVTIINPCSKKNIQLNKDVLLNNGIIEKIQNAPKKAYPSDYEILDCTGKFITAGLWDSHIHFFQSGGLFTRPDVIDLQHRVSYDSNQTYIKKNLKETFRRYLSCGITNVIDCGGPDWNVEIAELSKIYATSPNVYFSGPLITSWKPTVYEIAQPPFTLALNIEDAIKEVKRQIQYKPNMIKVWYIVGKKTKAEDYFPVLKAICDTSHKYGYPVWVHATELTTAKYAIKADCDVLVHLPKDEIVDDEFLKLAKDSAVSIIPTIWVFESYNKTFSYMLDLLNVELQKGDENEIFTLFQMPEIAPEELSERILKRITPSDKLIRTDTVILRNMLKVMKAGINIAAGTDAGNIGALHGPSLFHEFMLMKEAGLTDEEILFSATNGASRLFKNTNSGTIEQGKKADIIIYNENPLNDIQNTQLIYRVIKSGNVLNPDTLIKSNIITPVIKQLNAYNAKNIDAFIDCYSDDVEVYEFPNKLLYTGKSTMKQNYAEYFKKAGANLHCKIINRMIYGDYVLDSEYITTSIPGREKFNGMAIYKITKNKINKVWFIK